MKKFIRKYALSTYNSKIFNLYFGGMKPCVFDIETTGLSSERSKVILTAMLIPIKGGAEITQFLAENPYEEKLVLAATVNFLNENDIDYLITYNGAKFDIPFVERRFRMLNLDDVFSYYNLDIYRLVRSYSGIGHLLTSMKQKDLENYMGIGSARRDTITGKEGIKLFYKYADEGDPIAEKLIITHNREDVLQLYKLLPILRDTDLHAAMFRYGFPTKNAKLWTRPIISRGKLIIRGEQLGSPVSLISFPKTSSDLFVDFSARDKKYRVALQLMTRGQSNYIDIRKFEFNSKLAEELSLQKLGGYVNDYLILNIDGDKKHREINTLSMLLMDIVWRRYISD